MKVIIVEDELLIAEQLEDVLIKNNCVVIAIAQLLCLNAIDNSGICRPEREARISA